MREKGPFKNRVFTLILENPMFSLAVADPAVAISLVAAAGLVLPVVFACLCKHCVEQSAKSLGDRIEIVRNECQNEIKCRDNCQQPPAPPASQLVQTVVASLRAEPQAWRRTDEGLAHKRNGFVIEFRCMGKTGPCSACVVLAQFTVDCCDRYVTDSHQSLTDAVAHWFAWSFQNGTPRTRK
jgi:hypothetical protein